MSDKAPDTANLSTTALDAYVYFYPLVMMDVTRRVSINLPPGERPGYGPMNAFHHLRQLPPAEYRGVVRFNFDTLYSPVWLDLTQEPMIVTVPETAGRYYLLPMLDMWTDVFATPGTRTTGARAGNFAVVPRGWSGGLPDGVEPIEAPTPYAWVIGRTQTSGPRDYPAVNAVQDGFRVTPLSRWGGDPEAPSGGVDPAVDTETPPLEQVNAMPASRFFPYAAELMKLHPPHITDWSMVARLGRLGIVPGASFDHDAAPSAVRASLESAVTDGLRLMQETYPTIARVANGWQMNTETMGVYGNHYLKRAVVAMVALGANPPEDAVYPFNIGDADGNPLDGAHQYVLHFDRDELPPVDAFWSVTMYDAEGFQVANPLGRFALGDRDPLRYNADGSLDLYLQHDSPGPGREPNWLPAPASGTLGVTMRLYAPQREVLTGRWNPPAIQRTA